MFIYIFRIRELSLDLNAIQTLVMSLECSRYLVLHLDGIASCYLEIAKDGTTLLHVEILLFTPILLDIFVSKIMIMCISD
jgi:hypothetical protein